MRQKAALRSASLKLDSKSSSELEGWAGAVRRNRWCLFLILQYFLPCLHPLQTDEMIYLINSRDCCKQNVSIRLNRCLICSGLHVWEQWFTKLPPGGGGVGGGAVGGGAQAWVAASLYPSPPLLEEHPELVRQR